MAYIEAAMIYHNMFVDLCDEIPNDGDMMIKHGILAIFSWVPNELNCAFLMGAQKRLRREQ